MPQARAPERLFLPPLSVPLSLSVSRSLAFSISLSLPLPFLCSKLTLLESMALPCNPGGSWPHREPPVEKG